MSAQLESTRGEIEGNKSRILQAESHSAHLLDQIQRLQSASNGIAFKS